LALQLHRYEESVTMKFMLRVSFIPPINLHDEVMHRFYAYLEEWEHELNHMFQAACDTGELINTDPSQATTAYLCLSDGVLTELVYSDKLRAFKRLEASWIYFWRGLSST
ncbi:TetR/AcrR family transcriptional regulator, partial [Neobacillus drentensis]